MKRALVLGGTGVVGQGISRRLLMAGWRVDLTGRDARRVPGDVAARGGHFLSSERRSASELASALGAGADLLVDCACYTAADAALLVPLLRDVGSTVMISSKAVYVDAEGRHVNSAAPPRFEGPIGEAQPTVAPCHGGWNTREGYAANKVAAEHLLLDSEAPVAVLRPSKVHGRGASLPRTWVFVRRVLERRAAVFLARSGRTMEHNTAAQNMAALVETLADRRFRGILNVADPDVPDGRAIARAVAEHLGHRWEEVLVDDATEDGLGDHPWNTAHPIVLDTTAAAALGHVAVGDFASTVREEVDWLVSLWKRDELRAPLVDLSPLDRFFDFDREDAFLATRSGLHGPER